MLQLNRNAEVSLHGQMADMEFTIERHGPDNWEMIIEGVSDVNLAAGDDGSANEQPLPRIKKSFTLNDEQASATLALLIGELENDADLNAKLYAIAEQVWSGVTNYLRPIP